MSKKIVSNWAPFCSPFLPLVLVCSLSLGCGSSKFGSVNRNQASFVYKPGFPQFSMNATGRYDQQNKAVATVTANVVPSSFITFSNDSLKQGQELAGFRIYFEVYAADGKHTKVAGYTENKIIVFNTDKNSPDIEEPVFKKDFTLPKAGKYEAYVTITDTKSGKSSRLQSDFSLPKATKINLGFSSITLTALDSSRVDKGYIPVTTYEVTRDFENLRFEAQIVNPEKIDSLEFSSRIIRFESDTEPAERMSAAPFKVSLLQKKGINYNDYEIIDKRSRTVLPGQKVFTYEVGIAVPQVGNYRYELTVKNVSNGSSYSRAFEFGVKRVGFPLVRTPRELAEPLIYLMSNKEYDSIMGMNDADSIKSAVDRFWLTHIKDAEKARSSIKLYYSRVEEANRLFSNYKEGWKTDFGMIYILFGPPLYNQTYFDYVHWAYSTNQYDPRYNYYFDQERNDTGPFPFEVYILDRSKPDIRENEYLVIQDWLSGSALYN